MRNDTLYLKVEQILTLFLTQPYKDQSHVWILKQQSDVNKDFLPLNYKMSPFFLLRPRDTSRTCTRTWEMDTTSSPCWRSSPGRHWWDTVTSDLQTHERLSNSNPVLNLPSRSFFSCRCCICNVNVLTVESNSRLSVSSPLTHVSIRAEVIWLHWLRAGRFWWRLIKKTNQNKLIFLICFHLVTSALTCLTLFVFSLLCFCWSTSCLLTCPLLLPLSSSSCDARAVVAQGTWRCEERAVGEWRLDCRPAGACVATPWWLLGCAWWQSHSLFFLIDLSFCFRCPFVSNIVLFHLTELAGRLTPISACSCH